MSQIAVKAVLVEERGRSDWQRLSRLAGVVAFVQLAFVLMTMVVVFTVGAEPETALAYYTVLSEQRLIGLLRLDFPTVIQMSLFPITVVGIYAALRESRPAYALLTVVLVVTGIVLGLANHSALSMIRLSDMYAAATSAADRELLLAAGEAVIATDIWNGTAGFLAGIFMQGAFVFISYVMLKTTVFSRWTAYTGMLANGLDLLHVFVGLVAPGVSYVLLAIGGVFYLAWFPLLGRDLWRAGRGNG